MPREPALLALDWGTSALRAYLLDNDGAILQRTSAPAGIQTVPDGRFRQTFEEVCAPFLRDTPALPVVACGMIGSRQGWREAPYLQVPVSPESLAQGVVRLDEEAGRPFAIVPGLLQPADEQAPPDVMRGEETKLLGILLEHAACDAVVLMPGTHSKWARLANGCVERFHTFMTGETFDVLSRHSILARLFEDGDDEAMRKRGFEAGVHAGQQRHGSLLNRLFGARTLGLTGALPGAALREYLSGLLIAEEVGAGLQSALAQGNERLLLLGSPVLVQRYQAALAFFGRSPEVLDEDIVATGLHAVASRAGFCP